MVDKEIFQFLNISTLEKDADGVMSEGMDHMYATGREVSLEKAVSYRQSGDGF